MRARAAAPGALVALAALAALVPTGCTGGADRPASHPSAAASTSASPTSVAPAAATSATAAATPDPHDPAYDAAVSTPRRDPVYPDVGDPGVDALHYGLDLAWTPATRTLRGVATIVFRAPAAADLVRLDLAPTLRVSAATLDGETVAVRHPGRDLLVEAPVAADSRHVLVLTYAGVPEPSAAPTTRADVATVGWTTTDDGAAWTMQEPYGAFTWYPVDDQPADKAFYDLTVTTTAPFTAVANGVRTAATSHDGLTTTSWHLDTPVSSYLVTVAVGDYRATRFDGPHGLPITAWVPDGTDPTVGSALRRAPDALAWVERRLGPYPFSSLGFVLVDSTSGMETQTMITLGAERYAVSEAVLVHELVHQWYGDEVTPADWRDVWMNEGMAMYLQFVWQAEHDGTTLAAELTPIIRREAAARAEDGPPGDYDPSRFAESNVYYGPALMWQALRQRIGDARFWRVVRAWPRTHADTSQGRDTFLPWLVGQTGVPRSFFDAWLLSPTSPTLTLEG